MSVLSRPTFTNGIIARAEFRHQRFVINSARAGRIWIALALIMLVPALLGSIAFTALALAEPFLPQLAELRNASLFGDVLFLTIAMNFSLYPVVSLILFGLGANTINREKRGKTWDNLRLTGQSAAQIVHGKWWATMWALNGDLMMVALLRFGLVAAAVAWLNPLFLIRWPDFPQMQPVLGLPPVLIHLPILIAIAIVYTFLDGALTVALGMIGSLVETGGPALTIVFLGGRFVLTGLALWFMAVTFAVVFAGGWWYIPLTLVGWVVYGLVIWGLLRIARALVG